MSKPVFVLIDGDRVGDRIDRFILDWDLIALSAFTGRLDQAVARIAKLARKARGKVFMAGGDNILVQHRNLERLLADLHSIRKQLPCTFSVGIGADPPSAHLALKTAKRHRPGTILRVVGGTSDRGFLACEFSDAGPRWVPVRAPPSPKRR